MSKTYAEFLAEQGATPEDIKLLDTPVAQRAFAKQLELQVAAESASAKALADKAAYDKWYKDVAEPTTQRALQEAAAARAETAASNARLKSLQDAGLIEVAADEEEKKKAAAAAASAAASAPDLSKYVTSETLNAVAEKEGDAIAIMADILQEHSELFPGQRITARELRKEAVAQHKSVEQVWMDRYKVPEARAAKSLADKTAHEKKIADDAVAAYKSQNLNPNTATPMASSNPFVPKPDAGRAEKPWLRAPEESANDRVNRVLKNHPELVH